MREIEVMFFEPITVRDADGRPEEENTFPAGKPITLSEAKAERWLRRGACARVAEFEAALAERAAEARRLADAETARMARAGDQEAAAEFVRQASETLDEALARVEALEEEIERVSTEAAEAAARARAAEAEVAKLRAAQASPASSGKGTRGRGRAASAQA